VESREDTPREDGDPGAELTPDPAAPGDEAPADERAAGENVCPECNGTGKLSGGRSCPNCYGSGRVIEAAGGG
jgi:RecJ-like exonuclease